MRADVPAMTFSKEVSTSREPPLAVILDALPIPAAYLDSRLVHLKVNASYARTFGRPPEALLGMTFADLLGPELISDLQPSIDAAVAGERAQAWTRIPATDPADDAPGPRSCKMELLPDRRAGEAAQPVAGVAALFHVPPGTILGPETDSGALNLPGGAHDAFSTGQTAVALQALMDSTQDLVALITPDLRILRLNRACLEFMNLSGEGLRGRLCFSLLGRDRPCENCPTVEAIKTGNPHSWERTFEGRPGLYEHAAIPVRGTDGEVAFLLEILRDVTRERERDARLRDTTSLLEAVLDNVPDIIGVLAPDLTVLRYNRAGYELHGLSSPHPGGRKCHELIGRLKACPDCPAIEALRSKQPARVERHFPERGQVIENRSTPVLDENGEVQFVVEILRDVTESVRREDMLRASIREKEVLLREVHHRVKNNLQIVSSLLNLQCGSIEDEGVRDMLLKSHDRIRAMAGAHEALYSGGDLASIDAAVYLGGLANSLRQCYGQRRVDLRLALESVPLTLDQAVPCGIIVNELLTNAFKHAFPAGEGGEVVLEFSCAESRCLLEVRDNGRGADGNQRGPQKTEGLGLKLVDALASQLGGQVSRSGAGGYRTSIAFALARHSSHPSQD